MSEVIENKILKFEALKMAFNNQVEYLRFLGQIDLRLFSGYITIQLVFASWLSKVNVESLSSKFGLLAIDGALSVVAVFLLVMNHMRRRTAIDNFKNIIEALGFTEKGIYLSGKTLFNSHKAPTSLP